MDQALKKVYVDLRLGNLCNLKCRMCNPGHLTQWVEEWNPKAPYDGSSYPQEERDRLAHMNCPNEKTTRKKTWEKFDARY